MAELKFLIEAIICIWLVLSIATSVAIVILFYKSINKQNSRDTNCKRCKFLIKYDANSRWPVLCKKVEPGFTHEKTNRLLLFQRLSGWRSGRCVVARSVSNTHFTQIRNVALIVQNMGTIVKCGIIAEVIAQGGGILLTQITSGL